MTPHISHTFSSSNMSKALEVFKTFFSGVFICICVVSVLAGISLGYAGFSDESAPGFERIKNFTVLVVSFIVLFCNEGFQVKENYDRFSKMDPCLSFSFL